jgi:acyl-CoA hydrolase
VRVVQMLPLRRFDYFDPQTAAHVQPVSMFLGGPSRPGAQAGWLPLIHTHLSGHPQLFARGEVPADVVFALASPMDAEAGSTSGSRPTTRWPPWRRPAPWCWR